MDAVPLEVVTFLDGPAAGERGEVPVEPHDVWRFVRGVGYCQYEKSDAGYRFTGKVKHMPELVAWLRERQPSEDVLIHADSDPPREKEQVFGLAEAEAPMRFVPGLEAHGRPRKESDAQDPAGSAGGRRSGGPGNGGRAGARREHPEGR